MPIFSFGEIGKRCTVRLAHDIGVAEPVSVNVDTNGTWVVPDIKLSAAVKDRWDLSPAGIISELDLLRPINGGTAALWPLEVAENLPLGAVGSGNAVDQKVGKP